MMEYLPGGNLADPWRTKDEWMWNEFEIAGILYQCLHALAHLHAKPNTIHRDIKPENILVERRYWFLCVKIGDFGLTKEGDMLGGKDDSWTYTSPEVLSGMFISLKTSPYQHSYPARSPIPSPVTTFLTRLLTKRRPANL